MSQLDRRQFVQSAALALPVIAMGRQRDAGRPALDPALLRALGEVVLPAELGSNGMRRIIEGFDAWTAGYRPAAELVHGYGTGEIAHAPPNPRARWTAQLVALDRRAHETHGAGFADLPPVDRHGLVHSALEHAPARLPSMVADAEHVAVALLAFFYDSPEATDLCYRAQIGKNGCRELSRAPEKPRPRASG